jgi:formylglycine-generating enzyme required for sulfatase activity
MRWLPGTFLAAALSLLAFGRPSLAPADGRHGCPPDMVKVRDFCIDRFEVATVDARSGDALSPYYPPSSRLVESVLQAWALERSSVGDPSAREMPLPELPLIQRSRSDYVPRAVSRAGVVPQGYLSYPLAKLACERGGKRLCSESEWITACKGQAPRKFPYGDEFEAGRCNVYRHVHPAMTLHGASWYGHRDPRLNLVVEPGEGPLLRLTGATPSCASRWGVDRVYDMVGNIDEWVEAETPLFVGGFYARSTREGCESRVSSHAPLYYDYSTGTRCCRAPLP